VIFSSVLIVSPIQEKFLFEFDSTSFKDWGLGVFEKVNLARGELWLGEATGLLLLLQLCPPAPSPWLEWALLGYVVIVTAR